jgi:hypothetical protein
MTHATIGAASSFSVTDFNYTWTLTVDAIPEPTGAAALLSGLVALGALEFAGRRKRRAACGGCG